MPQMQLYGGPKDGLVVKVKAGERPDVFYATTNEAESLIRQTQGNKAKAELRQRYSILAYRFEKIITKVGIGLEYRFVRAPELDKKPDDAVDET